MNVPNKRKTDHHGTPQKVFDYLFNYHKLDLKNMFDPCPLHAEFDGLKTKWLKRNYINAPYELIEEFTKKAFHHFLKDNVCYLLFPLSKSDKPWAHRFIFDMYFKLIFIPFRIKFDGNEQPSFDTHCLVCMN